MEMKFSRDLKRTNLSGEVLEYGSEIDGSASTNTLGVLAGLQEPGYTTDGKLQTGLATPRGSLLRCARS